MLHLYTLLTQRPGAGSDAVGGLLQGWLRLAPLALHWLDGWLNFKERGEGGQRPTFVSLENYRNAAVCRKHKMNTGQMSGCLFCWIFFLVPLVLISKMITRKAEANHYNHLTAIREKQPHTHTPPKQNQPRSHGHRRSFKKLTRHPSRTMAGSP